MKKIIKTITFVTVFAAMALVVFPVAAQIKTVEGGSFGLAQGTSIHDLISIITSIVNVVLGLAGIIAAIAIIYGGFMYITAAADEDNAEKGKKIIMWAIIGLIIIGLSGAIVNFVVGTPRGGGSTGPGPAPSQHL